MFGKAYCKVAFTPDLARIGPRHFGADCAFGRGDPLSSVRRDFSCPTDIPQPFRPVCAALATARSFAGNTVEITGETSIAPSFRLALLLLQHHSGQLFAAFHCLFWIRGTRKPGGHFL